MEQSLGGTESRRSVRGTPWVRMSYEVLPYDHVERAKLETRLREGLKAAGVAVPYWGRGVALADEAAAGALQLRLNKETHRIAAASRVLVQSRIPARYDEFDLCLVQAVAGSLLTVAAPTSYTYPAGTRVWPLLYGKPIYDQFSVLNSTRSRFQLAVQFDGRQVSAQAFDDFGDYAPGVVSSPLSGGEGWLGAWVLSEAA